MKIIRGIDQYPETNSELAIALGTFDGVHLGHQKLIHTLKCEAEMDNLQSLVFTFFPHPLSIVAPQSVPPMLTTLEQRADLISCQQVDFLLVANFNRQLAEMKAEEFILDILVDRLKVKKIIIGFNNTFGYKGLGTPDMLQQYGENLRYKTIIVEPVKQDNLVVSSTEIRNRISAGEIRIANKLLGRNFFLTGTVVSGDGRGKSLGFPTANVDIDPSMAIPDNGVYAVKVIHDGITYPGALNIGRKPTFAGKSQTVEVNIIGFEGNIYGSELKIEFLEKLRNEKMFESPGELSSQIEQDVKSILSIFR